MAELLVPVSPGELIDKITILEIKSDRIPSESARSNVAHELRLLTERAQAFLGESEELRQLKARLASVNETLWDIEDQIREKEAAGTFDEDFIRLARAVYVTNDERARVKRQINTLASSEVIEEKWYSPYPNR